MRFETDRIVIAGLLERTKLRCPVDEALSNRGLLNLSRRALHRILAVAMMDTILGQCLPRDGKRV